MRVDWPARLLAGYAALQAAEVPAADAYVYACAAEQVLSDLALLGGGPSLVDLRAAVVALAAPGAEVAWQETAPCQDDLLAWLRVAWAGMPEDDRHAYLGAVGSGPRWADCLAPNPIDFERYGGEVGKAFVSMTGRLLVVGIRTAGSYLAPIWVRVAREAGLAASYVTVRPERHVAGGLVVRDLPTIALSEVDEVVVVDDGTFSGRTLTHVVDQVLAANPGVRVRSSVCFVGDIGALNRQERAVRSSFVVMTGSARDVPAAGRVDPQGHFAHAVGRLADGRYSLAAVDVLPPGYWQQLVLDTTSVPRHMLDGIDHRIRKQRFLLAVDGVDHGHQVVAKYIGWGPLAEREARLLRDHWYGPDLLGWSNGYLLHVWQHHITVAAGSGPEWSDDDLTEVGEWAVRTWRQRYHRPGTSTDWAARRRKVVDRWTRWSPDVAAVTARMEREDSAFPIVRLPRNQGFWHYGRRADGRMTRFHQDIGRWSRDADVAWDLASTIVEFGLDAHQAGVLAGPYVAATTDTGLPARLPFAIAEYGAHMIAEFEEHSGALTEIPPTFRRSINCGCAPFHARVRNAVVTVERWLDVPPGTTDLPRTALHCSHPVES